MFLKELPQLHCHQFHGIQVILNYYVSIPHHYYVNNATARFRKCCGKIMQSSRIQLVMSSRRSIHTEDWALCVSIGCQCLNYIRQLFEKVGDLPSFGLVDVGAGCLFQCFALFSSSIAQFLSVFQKLFHLACIVLI